MPDLGQVETCVYCGGLFANALYVNDHEPQCAKAFAERLGLRVADPPRHHRRPAAHNAEPVLEM